MKCLCTLATRVLIVMSLALIGNAQPGSWQAKAGPLGTRWTATVSPSNVHQEYPRPQMVREAWKNLNGLWDYAVRAKNAGQPREPFDGEILVPFSITSALSGVMTQVGPENQIWYRRTFQIPTSWRGQTVLLHFEAVDWTTTVWVNGKKVGFHQGGYTPFSCDITSALKDEQEQTLLVSAWDPTDAGFQPRGKQVRNPHRIWYTPTTGIWQTVWLESVSETHIDSLKVIPDIDEKVLELSAYLNRADEGFEVQAEALDGKQIVATATGAPNKPMKLHISNPKLWSPESPFLYDLKVSLRRDDTTVDEVGSYFGMRKISVEKDRNGILRLFLNNQALFQYGPLDQGFWPDGIYTAPTDEALRYDIEVTKDLGFNMIRKHVKVEPRRWYYWADKLGVLVWQDMPSGDRYIRRDEPDIQRVAQSAYHFEQELKETIDSLYNHPSIVMWVPFNEGWGQYDTGRITQWIKHYDPSRLVNSASGWADRGVGDVHDIHAYPGPSAPPIDPYRAIVLGEFGGLGLPIKGHTWQSEENWGYRSYQTQEELTDAYVDLLDQLRPLIDQRGLSAAVYTQTTDVEIEVNGLLTYDRERIKMDKGKIQQANASLYQLVK